LTSQSQSISFTGCLLQRYFIFPFGCTEYFFIAVMTCDHYLAVCYSLSYSTIMTSTLSRGLVVSSWCAGGFLIISVPICLISGLSFCASNITDHFFCDISPWLALSCS
ncbi:OR6F1 protein, partial [Sakesphorus luctuosus]|nr:OR6F1 protein [Sakesphorus luctuosus]